MKELQSLWAVLSELEADMTEKEIAEKIRQSASAMAEAVKKGYDISLKSSRDGVSIFKNKPERID